MKVLLSEIETFSKCPAYYHFSLRSVPVPVSQKLSIINEVIRKCYIRHTEHGYRVGWKQVMGWIDNEIFEKVNVTNDESYQRAVENAEQVSGYISNWFERIYRKEEYEGFTDTPLQYTIAGHQFCGIAPVIKLTEPPTIICLSETISNPLEMYNDIGTRGLAWLVARQLDIPSVHVEMIHLGAEKNVRLIEMVVNEEMNKRTEKAMIQIANNIAAGVNYPSFTSMCNGCPFRKECYL